MSQHNGSAADGGSAPVSLPAPAKSKSTGKTLGVVGGSIVALGALAAFVVLPAVHGSTPTAASALNFQQAADATGAEPAGAVGPIQALATASAVPRDPFSPLVTLTPVVAASSGSASPTTTATGNLAPTTSATPTTVVPTKVTIDLYSVTPASKSVEVTLNSAVYVVKEGQTFGGNFMLLAITPTSATFDYGDQPFVLGVGQSQTFS